MTQPQSHNPDPHGPALTPPALSPCPTTRQTGVSGGVTKKQKSRKQRAAAAQQAAAQAAASHPAPTPTPSPSGAEAPSTCPVASHEEPQQLPLAPQLPPAPVLPQAQQQLELLAADDCPEQFDFIDVDSFDDTPCSASLSLVCSDVTADVDSILQGTYCGSASPASALLTEFDRAAAAPTWHGELSSDDLSCDTMTPSPPSPHQPPGAPAAASALAPAPTSSSSVLSAAAAPGCSAASQPFDQLVAARLEQQRGLREQRLLLDLREAMLKQQATELAVLQERQRREWLALEAALQRQQQQEQQLLEAASALMQPVAGVGASAAVAAAATAPYVLGSGAVRRPSLSGRLMSPAAYDMLMAARAQAASGSGGGGSGSVNTFSFQGQLAPAVEEWLPLPQQQQQQAGCAFGLSMGVESAAPAAAVLPLAVAHQGFDHRFDQAIEQMFDQAFDRSMAATAQLQAEQAAAAAAPGPQHLVTLGQQLQPAMQAWGDAGAVAGAVSGGFSEAHMLSAAARNDLRLPQVDVVDYMLNTAAQGAGAMDVFAYL